MTQKEPEDYEQVLASLAVDIQKRQARLSEIRLRERRTTLAITLYTLAAWVAYGAAWYIGWRPLKAIPIFAGPIMSVQVFATYFFILLNVFLLLESNSRDA